MFFGNVALVYRFRCLLTEPQMILRGSWKLVAMPMQDHRFLIWSAFSLLAVEISSFCKLEICEFLWLWWRRHGRHWSIKKNLATPPPEYCFMMQMWYSTLKGENFRETSYRWSEHSFPDKKAMPKEAIHCFDSALLITCKTMMHVPEERHMQA